MKVEIKVKEVKGTCSAGYKVGDLFFVEEPVLVSDGKTPLCLYALSAMLPYITAYCRKTEEQDWINALEELQCPDCKNAVIFALRRGSDN